MPNICAVLGCTAHFRQRETNLGLHRIPKDPGLRKKWIQACGAIGVNQNARVCSLHFKTTDYEKITRRYDLLQIPVPKSLRQLKASVVPTLLLPTIQGNGVELDVSTSAAPPLSHVEVKADKSEAGNMADFDIKEEDIEIKEEAVEVKQENPETEESGSTARRGEKRVLSPSHSPETKKQRTEVEQVWIKEEAYEKGVSQESPMAIKMTTSFSWSTQATFTLLEKVRDREELWKAKHRGYNKKTLRRALFEEITKELKAEFPSLSELTTEDVIVRLIYLRGHSRKLLRKLEKTPSGSGGKVTPKWEYFEACSFLTPVYSNTTSASSVQPTSNTSEKIYEVAKIKNLRSAYGKLKNRAGSAGKSGQASCRLTSRQEWKLRNLAFLDEVIQPRTQGEELGRVAGEDEDDDDDDDDVEAREDFVAPDNEDENRGTEGRKRGSSADSQDSASKRNRNRAGTSTSTSRKEKGANSTPDVGEILTEMLLENRRRDRETEKKLEESATRQPDEREAWGSWLQTVVRNCPKEKFRQFQMETLALSQRYQPTDEGHRTSGQQCPAPPAMFPPQAAASQFPAQGQFQHPSQQFQGQPQPQFHYQQQQMQQPGYMRQPTFTQLLNQSTQQQQPQQQPHQQQHQQQHQPTRPTSAPTPVGISNIIARSYEIANKDDGDLDFIPALRTPALGDRLSLSGFSAGCFGIHGTSGDQSVVGALMRAPSSSESDAD